MTAPHYARIVAQLLGREPRTIPGPGEASRARAIAHIELALAAKAQRKNRARTLFALVAAAAVIVVAVGYRLRAQHTTETTKAAAPVVAILQPTGNGAQLFTPVGAEPLRGGSALPIGGRLIANPAGGAALQLSTGTQIKIEQDANLIFSDAGPTQRFELSGGAIQAHVAKLHAGERFIVATPDAEVEVRGTQFQLRVVAADSSCGNGTRTRLAVTEGVVEVRAQGLSALVHPGEAWPAGCSEPNVVATNSAALAPSSRSMVHEAHAAASSLRASSAASAPSATPTTEASSLSEQNDLYASGMASRRSGDAQAAVSKFQELLARFPRSALAESALAESMRVEQRLDAAAAQRFARQYLQRYPDGFARRDAQAILASP